MSRPFRYYDEAYRLEEELVADLGKLAEQRASLEPVELPAKTAGGRARIIDGDTIEQELEDIKTAAAAQADAWLDEPEEGREKAASADADRFQRLDSYLAASGASDQT